MIFLQNICLFFTQINYRKFPKNDVDNVYNSVYNSIFSLFYDSFLWIIHLKIILYPQFVLFYFVVFQINLIFYLITFSK